jgi:hypothetical protein
MAETDVLDMQDASAPSLPAVSHPHALPMSANASAHPDNLLAMALQQGASLEQLERLMALKERHEANEARKAYTSAITAFKKNPPTIIKDKKVAFSGTEYNHATLGNVVRQIIAGLAEHDISHSWSTQQLEGGQVAVTCTLTHAMGHSESVTLQSSKDDSGKKNNIQALGSAITYLQRYTLLSITGLATEEQDDDGESSTVGAEDVAEEIANRTFHSLIQDLESTTTDEAAKLLWDIGSKALHATGSKGAYADFKTAVINHRNALKNAGGAR